MSLEVVLVSVVGSSVAMGGALAVGFKSMVNVVSKQLQTQNGVIEKLSNSIKVELDEHVASCKICQEDSGGRAAKVVADAAKAAATAVTDAVAAARKVKEDG